MGSPHARAPVHCSPPPPQGRLGNGLSLAASTLLAGAMGARLLKTGKVMPAGMLTGVGLASAAFHGQKFAEWA